MSSIESGNRSAYDESILESSHCTGIKVVVRAEILPRDFLQTPGNYYL